MGETAERAKAEGVRIEQDGGVVTITIDRPSRHNTLDDASVVELSAFLDETRSDPSVRCLLLTATGQEFCTGADIVSSGVKPADPIDYRYGPEPYLQLFKRLWETEKPVVSAVNGTVAGIGWMLALLADLVVASEDARWVHVFLRRGMVPHGGDPFFLPRIIPFHRLNEIALLSDPVLSSTLADWGLVNRAVPADEVAGTALELATRLADGPTRSLGLTKQLYRRSLTGDMESTFNDERMALALISTTHDRAEGMASFMERRPAAFTGN